MPFHHPVRLAVQLALLDNLSKGRIDVGIGKGTVYNEYEFVGHGLRSHDSRERMEEAVDILERAWREAPLTYDGKFHKVHIPAIRPKPVQQPGPPLWRCVISPGSFTECGKARRADPDRAAAGRAHQGALGDSTRPASPKAATTSARERGCWRRARCGATSMSPNPTRRPRTSSPGCSPRRAPT